MRWSCVACAVTTLAACHHDRKPVAPPPDDMLAIASRTYLGDSVGCPAGATTRRPLSETYKVQLQAPAYKIDRRLVTCEQFDSCVSAGVCKHDDVMCVDGLVSVRRKTAAPYCQWRNARLPTWIEWQLAIRGPDGWDYPTHDKHPEYDFEEVAGTRTTSALGVEYRFNAKVPLNAELTRDDDCLSPAPDAPVVMGPVSGTTAIQLGETIDREGTERGSFRCVRD